MTNILPEDETAGSRQTFVERLFSGDWRAAALVAGSTVFVAFVLGLVVNSYLIWIGAGEDDFGFLDHSSAGFFRGSVAVVGMAFGTPAFVSAGSGSDASSYHAGMAPLTVTLLTIVVFVLLLRRYDAPLTAGDRAAQATRAALLTAVGLALLTIGMYATIHADGARVHQSGSPGRVFGWSLLLFVAAALIVSLRREDIPERMQQTLDTWRLPLEGAVVAMATGIIVGGLIGILILVAEADGGRLDILKALPILLAYLVNLGVDVFHVAMGGALHASFSGRDGGAASVSLFDRQGLSAAYLLLFFLPPICILVGVNWIHRYRGTVTAPELARACYRMALPAAVIYLLVALPSRVGFGFSGSGDEFLGGGGGGGHAGVQVLFGTLITFGWFLVLGFAIGQWLLPRGAGGVDGSVRRPVRLSRWIQAGSLSAAPLLIVAGVIGVLCSAGGIATADSGVHEADFGPASGFLFFGALGETSSEGADEVGAQSFTDDSQAVPVLPVTPSPGVRPALPITPEVDAASSALRSYAVAEEVYFTENQTYTTDASLLMTSPDQEASTDVAIVRADSQTFCLEAFAGDGSAYTYDSTMRTVTPGATC